MPNTRPIMPQGRLANRCLLNILQVLLNDFFGHGRSSGPSVAAVLHDHRHGDLRVVDGRVGDEPRMVPRFSGKLPAGDLLRNDLGGPRLSGHGRERSLCRVTGAAGLGHDACQRLAYTLECYRVDGDLAVYVRGILPDLPGLTVPGPLEQGRTVEIHPVRDDAHELACLYRTDENESLPYRIDEGVPAAPFIPGPLLLPRGRGNEARFLVGHHDAGQGPVAQFFRLCGDVVPPDAFPHGIEVDVAGLDEGPMERYGAVPFFFPAPEAVVAALERAPAVYRVVGVDRARLEAGQRNDDLERGARGIDALDRPVVHGVGRICHQTAPVLR